MIALYRFLLPVLGILTFPYYAYRMIRRGGYSVKFRYRAGFWPKLQAKKPESTRIWIQAVSVGELSSLAKLLDSLLSDPSIEIILSGTTSTGLNMASEKYGERVIASGPFPFDWLPFSRKAWRRIDPDLAILVDSELWPEHFHQAKKRNVPLLIINARLSDRTFARLASPKLKWAHSLLFPENLSVIAASERQHARWIELDFPSSRVKISGNLKIDAVDKSLIYPEKKKDMRKELGFSENTLVLAGVSTWSGEEKLLIELVQSLRLEKIDIKLLIIPRHAERRHEIKRILETSGLPHHLRSSSKESKDGSIAYLADTTGEVMSLLQSADFAFMGKSLPPHHGGQNPIEPVALSLPLVVGPNHQNFRETCAELQAQNAILVGENLTATNSLLLKLVREPNLREAMQRNCQLWMKKQGTPSEFTLAYIYDVIQNLDKS
jgi:3-deoxy-D-manno-octulosonic-acid transferase